MRDIPPESPLFHLRQFNREEKKEMTENISNDFALDQIFWKRKETIV